MLINAIVAMIVLISIPLIYVLFISFRKEYRKYKLLKATRAAIRRAEIVLHRETISEPRHDHSNLSVGSTIIDETVNIHSLLIDELLTETEISILPSTTNDVIIPISSYPTAPTIELSSEDLPPSYEECPSYEDCINKVDQS